jgi:hypothetical protein
MPGHPCEVLQVARIGQAVQVDQLPDFGSLDEVMDEIGADKAGPTGD